MEKEKISLVMIAAGSYQWDNKTFYRLFGIDENGQAYRYNPSKDNEGWIALSMDKVVPNKKDE